MKLITLLNDAGRSHATVNEQMPPLDDPQIARISGSCESGHFFSTSGKISSSKNRAYRSPSASYSKLRLYRASAFAFAAGITLLTGVPEVIISCVKAALFGLIAGLVACYRGLMISGGGAKAVGNAVNETVVYAFMALFVVNVVVTAIGIRLTTG